MATTMDEQAPMPPQDVEEEKMEASSGDGNAGGNERSEAASPVDDAGETSAGEEIITTLNDNDVLLGRGRGSSKFIGNLRFRDVVKQYKRAYNAAPTQREKVSFAYKVHNEIVERGGRFLERVDDQQPSRSVITTGSWRIATGGVGIERCKQSLREKELTDEERAIAKAKRKAKAAEKRGISPPPLYVPPHRQMQYNHNTRAGIPHPQQQPQNYFMPMPPPYGMIAPPGGMLAPVDPRWLFFQKQQQQMARNGLYPQFGNGNYPPPPPPPPPPTTTNMRFHGRLGGPIGLSSAPPRAPFSEQANMPGHPNGMEAHNATSVAPRNGTSVSTAEKDAVSGLFALVSGGSKKESQSDGSQPA